MPEQIYAREACPDDLLGMSAEQFGSENPFPWLSEQTDLNKEKNFFETQVTEYQSGGSLDW